MKIHISNSQVLAKHRYNFQGHHAFELLNGQAISTGRIPDVLEDAFIADGAIALPHMLDSAPIGPEIAGVGPFGYQRGTQDF
jgi:hypothetical protein